MTSNETIEVLSIGMIIGGQTPGNRAWVEALRDLTAVVANAREGVASELNVNIEFQVPGNLLRPDFEGIRTGTFRKADALLKVQVALPDVAPSNPRSTLLELLASALESVDSWAAKSNTQLTTSALRGILATVSTTFK